MERLGVIIRSVEKNLVWGIMVEVDLVQGEGVKIRVGLGYTAFHVPTIFLFDVI